MKAFPLNLARPMQVMRDLIAYVIEQGVSAFFPTFSTFPNVKEETFTKRKTVMPSWG